LKDYSWKKNRMSFGGTKELNPCKECTRRYEGCHSSCEDYLSWKAENDAEHARILYEKKKISNANGHAIITITRTTGKKPKAY
jgi:hypothetical protein